MIKCAAPNPHQTTARPPQYERPSSLHFEFCMSRTSSCDSRTGKEYRTVVGKEPASSLSHCDDLDPERPFSIPSAICASVTLDLHPAGASRASRIVAASQSSRPARKEGRTVQAKQAGSAASSTASAPLSLSGQYNPGRLAPLLGHACKRTRRSTASLSDGPVRLTFIFWSSSTCSWRGMAAASSPDV